MPDLEAADAFPPPPALEARPPTPSNGSPLVGQDAIAVRQNLARRVILSLRDIGKSGLFQLWTFGSGSGSEETRVRRQSELTTRSG